MPVLRHEPIAVAKEEQTVKASTDALRRSNNTEEQNYNERPTGHVSEPPPFVRVSRQQERRRTGARVDEGNIS